MPPAFARRGLELVVPQRVAFADPDWTGVVTKLRDARVRMVTGVLPPPLAAAFFKTAQKLGYTHLRVYREGLPVLAERMGLSAG